MGLETGKVFLGQEGRLQVYTVDKQTDKKALSRIRKGFSLFLMYLETHISHIVYTLAESLVLGLIKNSVPAAAVSLAKEKDGWTLESTGSEERGEESNFA